jgi:hypothetical protein
MNLALKQVELFSTPQGRNVLNSAVMPDLSERMQRDKGIEKISAAGVEMVGDQVTLLLDIDYNDGRPPARGVPATKGKSSNHDDTISLQPISALKKNILQA